MRTGSICGVLIRKLVSRPKSARLLDRWTDELFEFSPLNKTSQRLELCTNLPQDGVGDNWDPGESQCLRLRIVNPCSVLIPDIDKGQKRDRCISLAWRDKLK